MSRIWYGFIEFHLSLVDSVIPFNVAAITAVRVTR